jgi:hypothetical protein
MWAQVGAGYNDAVKFMIERSKSEARKQQNKDVKSDFS